jgi:hypothetical protein
MALRCPPRYAAHGSGAPDVSTVVAVIPGTTSRAERTSIRIGSAAANRLSTSPLASLLIIPSTERRALSRKPSADHAAHN